MSSQNRNRNNGFSDNKQEVVSITYEEIGLFPRSFSRVLDRFLKQIFSDVENLVIQEYRFYRYLFLTTFKSLCLLFLVPFFVNFLAKNYVIRPLTEYFWNTKQTEIFLNSYQQKRAFAELKDFEEKLYFESLIYPKSAFHSEPTSTEGSFGKTNIMGESHSSNTLGESEQPNLKGTGIASTPTFNGSQWQGMGSTKTNLEGGNTVRGEILLNQKMSTGTAEVNGITNGTFFAQQNPGLALSTAHPDAEWHRAGARNTPMPNGIGQVEVSGWSAANRRDNVVTQSNDLDSSSMSGVSPSLSTTALGESLAQGTLGSFSETITPKGILSNTNVAINNENARLVGVNSPGTTMEGKSSSGLQSSPSDDKTESLINSYTLKSSLFVYQTREADKNIQQRYQEKTIELAQRYNDQSIEAITNFFGDVVSLLTLFYLFYALEIQINITKSFLLEVFFGLDDSKKSLLILLVTDLLVGYHSSNLWELFFEFIFHHYGLPESQTGIFLLVATLPVLLDVLFKYLIFRHLNRSSPATVATYHAMIE